MRLAALVLACLALAPPAPDRPIDFWSTQRRGTNVFSELERRERFEAARAFGIQFVRLAPNKWLNGRPADKRGDFLIGRPGAFTHVDQQDVAYLRRVLDDADATGIKVVLTMLSLPGARWSQHNNGVEERRVWQDPAAQDRAIACWTELASALKGHPALVGYNLRNEPSPERVPPRFADWYTGDYLTWYNTVRGTPADLNLFYRNAVTAIRRVDPETPIVLDSGFYATPWAFTVLQPLDDAKTIYSFHMYEPYAYTSRNNRGRYTYPGTIPTGEGDTPVPVKWDRQQIDAFLAPVTEWQTKHHIPSSRIFAGEFGIVRTNAGAIDYLRDVIDVLNAHGWHWAFYGFREDGWDAMDYELGTGKPGAKYWDAIEHGRMPGPDVYRPNPLSDLLRRAVNGSR